MVKKDIYFKADDRKLTLIGDVFQYAPHEVNFIEAHFDLGTNWDEFASVRSVWYTDFVQGIEVVLDSNGVCNVPPEVLTRKAKVKVNLVGSESADNVLVDRLLTNAVVGVCSCVDNRLNGTNTAPITPSQFEQFVEIVHDEVETVTGMSAEATTLPPGSDATASYSDGVLSFGIPRGEKGEDGQDGRDGTDGADGNGIESAVLNPDYTLTLNFTDGTSYTTASIRGAEGNGISSIAKTGTSGLVDTYTITFDDGTTTTFTVTNGAKGDTGLTPSFSIGTVETLEPNEQATASITGTDEAPVLNLGIPKGNTGEVTEAELNEKIAKILPEDTASGTIASFPDGTDLLGAKSVLVELEPIQSGSGTPSPDNVRPITGRTECVTNVSARNLFVGEANEMVPLHLAQGTKVVASANSSVVSYYYDANGNQIDYWTLTQQSGGRYYRAFTLSAECFYFKFGGGTDLQIEIGTSPTAYEAPTTYTTPLGRTVYGGSVEQVGGQLTDKMGMVDLGDLNWVTYNASRRIYRATVSDGKPYSDNAQLPNVISSNYATVTGNDTWVNGIVSMYVAQTAEIIVCDTNYADVESFKTAMSGVQLCYELATPQTYSLTGQEVELLKGQNNVFSDGDVTVDYYADIQLWVEKKLG